MRNTVFALALSLPIFVSAGELTVSCIGPDTEDCPVAVDALFRNEKLTATFTVGPHVGGIFPTETLGFCHEQMYWVSPLRPVWKPKGCYLEGSIRVINGELTKRQLAERQLYFEFHKMHTQCKMDLNVLTAQKPICVKVDPFAP